MPPCTSSSKETVGHPDADVSSKSQGEPKMVSHRSRSWMSTSSELSMLVVHPKVHPKSERMNQQITCVSQPISIEIPGALRQLNRARSCHCNRCPNLGSWTALLGTFRAHCHCNLRWPGPFPRAGCSSKQQVAHRCQTRHHPHRCTKETETSLHPHFRRNRCPIRRTTRARLGRCRHSNLDNPRRKRHTRFCLTSPNRLVGVAKSVAIFIHICP